MTPNGISAIIGEEDMDWEISIPVVAAFLLHLGQENMFRHGTAEENCSALAFFNNMMDCLLEVIQYLIGL